MLLQPRVLVGPLRSWSSLRETGSTWVDVSPDGRWIYYYQRDTAGSDIMLVENFVVDR